MVSGVHHPDLRPGALGESYRSLAPLLRLGAAEPEALDVELLAPDASPPAAEAPEVAARKKKDSVPVPTQGGSP